MSIPYNDKSLNNINYNARISVENIDFNNRFNNEFLERYRASKLEGWIGIHSTIKSSLGELNDQNFSKNKFYNPNQLRLYVRNKLAVENFLDLLNNTQAFSNYIEGEIHFDILDDDHFEDIATSNRQNIDEHDERVMALKSAVNFIINKLISKRNSLAESIREEQDKIIEKRKTNAKTQFGKELEKDLRHLNIPSNKANPLITSTVAKIKGDLEAKDEYSVFISHRRCEKCISDLIYYYLISIGAKDDEIFYTSRPTPERPLGTLVNLENVIKDSIVNKNTLITYCIGGKFKESEYTMFEAGAGWAVKGKEDYILIPHEVDHIPEYLRKGNQQTSIAPRDKFKLTENVYRYLVFCINEIIDHINSGRDIKSIPLLSKIPNPNIPPLHERSGNEDISSYVEKKFLSCWNTYVIETNK